MNNISKVLWIDCCAGATVGIFVLIFHNWLSSLYGLPLGFVLFQGSINLAYSCFSFSLAIKKQRPYLLFSLLAAANITWGILCIIWFFYYRETASLFGLAHLFLESIFVAGLGFVEWSNRRVLGNA